MSGPFGSSQWMYSSDSSGGGFYPYEIGQSLRFNDDDSAYLSRTPASAGNRKTWTWSGWVKRGNLSGDQVFIAAAVSAGISEEWFQFNSGNKLEFRDGSGAGTLVETTAVFRDASAWYHVVFVYDSANATQADRGIFYVNGIRQATTTAAISLNRDSYINNATAHGLGRFGSIASNYFDGYMAEVNFIDGSALDPTSFGQFKSDIWVPKEYTGSYGTNGFYLSFADSAAIGDDLSGNANDWTANNLVATDVLLDSPTNNFNVLNTVSPKNSVLSNGNLQQGGSTSLYNINSTFSMTSGKWYAEFCVVSTDGFYPEFGILPNSANFLANASMYQLNRGFAISGAAVYVDGSSVGTYTGITSAGTIVGIAYDADTREVRYSVNGVLQNSGNAVATLSTTYEPDGYSFAASGYTSAVSVANFGQDSSFAGNKTAQGNTDDNGQGDFYYAPPAGYLALNTANLPDPAIDPAADDVPADYFNTVLYTGDGTSSHAITGVGFQPDFTWIKERNGTAWHRLSDAIRGPNALLFSNDTSAEDTTAGNFLSFDTDGFTVGSDGSINGNTDTYVAWNWLAGNGTSSNTDGTITSTVSVNQKAGFSVVSAPIDSSGGTIGHGLETAPSMIIVKNRDVSGTNWGVWHTEIGTTQYLLLNSTAAVATNATLFNGVSDTTFTVGSGWSVTSANHIAYCFAEVEGFSKFGSYTGNGSTDGPFVYCGFRPAFVMIKATSTTADWVIIDNKRNVYNPSGKWLLPNTSGAEFNYDALYPIDFLANGFKVKTSVGTLNTSAGTYIFAAFAEQPVKYSNAR